MNILKHISITIGLTVLAGCSSTPTEFENFTVNGNDSFAKTTMRLAGSNKFVDSKDGTETKREVIGSDVMQMTRLFMLDFSGLAQSAIADNIIEDEPLAKYPFFLVEVPYKNNDHLKSDAIIQEAQTRFDALINNADLTLKNMQTIRGLHSYDFTGSKQCVNLDESFTCVLNVNKGKLKTYDKGAKKAYIEFQSGGYIAPLYLMSKYKESDISLYIPQRLTYFSGTYTQYVTKHSVIINSGLAHKFIRNHKLHDGIPAGEVKAYGYRRNDKLKEKKYYVIDGASLTVKEIDPNTPL